jgi:hypothetical protein
MAAQTVSHPTAAAFQQMAVQRRVSGDMNN